MCSPFSSALSLFVSTVHATLTALPVIHCAVLLVVRRLIHAHEPRSYTSYVYGVVYSLHNAQRAWRFLGAWNENERLLKAGEFVLIIFECSFIQSLNRQHEAASFSFSFSGALLLGGRHLPCHGWLSLQENESSFSPFAAIP